MGRYITAAPGPSFDVHYFAVRVQNRGNSAVTIDSAERLRDLNLDYDHDPNDPQRQPFGTPRGGP